MQQSGICDLLEVGSFVLAGCFPLKAGKASDLGFLRGAVLYPCQHPEERKKKKIKQT